MSNFNFPDFNSITPPKEIFEAVQPFEVKNAQANYASEFYKIILETIQDFDSELDNENEVAVRLVSFGQTVTFSVHDLGYYNPSIICFYGTMPDGSPVQLTQHVSQISFLLTSVKRSDPCIPKKPIGFIDPTE